MVIHRHTYTLKRYEEGILRGECRCGEVRFEVADYNKEYVARATELNKTMAVKGRNMGEIEANSIKEPELAPNSINQIEGNREKRKFSKKDKEAIFKVLDTEGRIAAEKQFNLSRRSMGQLIKTHKGKVSIDSPPDTKVHQSTPRDTKVQVAGLPAFPAFSDTWPMLTQIEWLQTYRDLARR
jgi:hypothetical protein